MAEYNQTNKVLLAALLALAGVAQAAVPPPVIPEESAEPSTILVLPSGMMLGGFHVQLEETTLSQVRQTAKTTGEIAHQGDAGASIYWLCYTIPVTGNANQRFWLIASGEMGGPEHDITELIVQNADEVASSADCPTLPARFQPVILDNLSVWPGEPLDDVILQTGGSHQSGNWLFLSSEKWGPSGQCKEAAQENTVSVHSVFGRVDTVDVGQITAC